MKRLFIVLVMIFFLGIYTKCMAGSVSVSTFITADDVTIAHLESMRSTFQNAINSADGGLLQTATVTAAKLDANASPVNRWDETFNDFVYSGLLPTTTSGTLTSTTSSGTAYIQGERVVKGATAKTYTASKHTYVDLSKNGTYTYQEVAIGAAAPSVATDSIRLCRVSSDAAEINQVQDLRATTLTSIASSTKIIDLDGDTQVQTEESSDEDKIRFDTGGTERSLLDSTGLYLNNDLFFEGSTANDFETKITATDPTADRTQTIQNNNGVIPLGTSGNTLFLTTTADTNVTLPAAGTLGNMSYSNTRYYVGSFTRDMTAASGNVAYTGIGFQPKAIMVIGGEDAATLNFLSWGFSDDTTEGDIEVYTTTGTYQTNSRLLAITESSGVSQSAVVASFDSDGFTLTWTKNGAPGAGTGTVKYLAFR